MNPEREVSGADKTLTEGSALPMRSANLTQRIWDIAKNNADRQIAMQIRSFEKVLLAAQKEADAKGVSIFDLVATNVKNGIPRYIEKLDDV